MNARRALGGAAIGGVIGGVVASLLLASPAAAHPLGNFTTNTSASLDIGPETVEITYVVDRAEIPALRAVQDIDENDDGDVDDGEGAAYGSSECRRLAEGLRLDVDGRRRPLRVGATRLTSPRGQAGLDTLRLECDLRIDAELGGGSHRIQLEDDNFDGAVGWREVVAVGSGMRLVETDVPRQSLSDALRSYPADRLQSPADQRDAHLSVRRGVDRGSIGPIAGPVAALPGGERFTRAFTDLVAEEQVTGWFVALAMLAAVALGAFHAVAPGHGKTVMAAYLLGRRGDRRLAVLLGLSVSLTHTASVLVLGIVVSTTQAVAPERFYPVLGAASGLLFAAVGVVLLRQTLAARARRAAGHDHGHGHDHDHAHDHASGHEHAHGGHAHHHPDVLTIDERAPWRTILAPGLAGGLVPSPSALLVFLGGVALGRAWLGVLLVVAFGLGIAATLVSAGYLLRLVGRALERRSAHPRWARVGRLTAVLPMLTAALIIVGGLDIARRAVAG